MRWSYQLVLITILVTLTHVDAIDPPFRRVQLFFPCSLESIPSFFLSCHGNDGVNTIQFLVRDAVGAGAMCMDGSPPGYYLRAGTVRKWIIHLEGNGWCSNQDECIVLQ
jgi:hypothetical protein